MSIEERLGYQFNDKELLTQALSHPSLSSEIRPAPLDNQRLEFLGDAVLELAITDYLFHHFPDLKEGLLTKLRASVVSKPALAKAARRIKLGEALFLSNGEEGSGGRLRASNLADALESLFGAVYLDENMTRAGQLVLQLLGPELELLDPETNHGNSKGELQETLQQISPQAPVYEIQKEDGPAHARTFVSTVSWQGQTLGKGQGPSKKASEITAAAEALKLKLWI
ncbi:MAG: ribonuclease III [Akkermansiaceae bacterium]|jgi:ribonuclease-3